MTDVKLLPCLCGGKPTLHENAEHRFRVACPECASSTIWRLRKKAIAKWNAVNAPSPVEPALASPGVTAETGWRSMESAPKDGTHILACRVPIGIRTTCNTHPPTVVHWFDDGFYTSVNEMAPERPFEATAWMPLPPPPVEGGAKAKTDGHAVHAAPAAVKRNDWMAEARRDMIIQALGGNVDALTVAFTWRYTPEGGAYWLKQCDFGLTDEGRARLHEMLAELDASTPPAKGGE